MNKIKFFALTVLTVMMVALVSCGGRQDATYKGRFGTIEFKGDTVTWTYDDEVCKGTYTGNAAKNGKVNITLNEVSKDGGKTFSDSMMIHKASVEDGVLTIELDGCPCYWSIVK
nr:hypothetical protein [uncultured Treponema sp.]